MVEDIHQTHKGSPIGEMKKWKLLKDLDVQVLWSKNDGLGSESQFNKTKR